MKEQSLWKRSQEAALPVSGANSQLCSSRHPGKDWNKTVWYSTPVPDKPENSLGTTQRQKPPWTLESNSKSKEQAIPILGKFFVLSKSFIVVITVPEKASSMRIWVWASQVQSQSTKPGLFVFKFRKLLLQPLNLTCGTYLNVWASGFGRMSLNLSITDCFLIGH